MPESSSHVTAPTVVECLHGTAHSPKTEKHSSHKRPQPPRSQPYQLERPCSSLNARKGVSAHQPGPSRFGSGPKQTMSPSEFGSDKRRQMTRVETPEQGFPVG